MSTIQTRLRNLETATADRSPFLVFVPEDPPTPGVQAAIDEARQAGRVVFILRSDDADL